MAVPAGLRVWTHHEDGEGRPYFFCAAARESRWDLPDGEFDWIECRDAASGSTFWHNARADLSIWDHPTAHYAAHWVECLDPASGRTFFYSPKERRSVWQRPKDADVLSAGLAQPHAAPVPGGPRLEGGATTVSTAAAAAAPAAAPAATPAAALAAEDDDDTAAADAVAAPAPPPATARPGFELEFKRGDSLSSSDGTAMALPRSDGGEFHDYVLKEGGGSSMFGRKSWKERFLVLKDGDIAWFASYKDYHAGTLPLKGRWTSLAGYRLEESLADRLAVRLIPVLNEAGARVWNLRCKSMDRKKHLVEALSPFTVSSGFVKSLDRELSGRRFLSDFD